MYVQKIDGKEYWVEKASHSGNFTAYFLLFDKATADAIQPAGERDQDGELLAELEDRATGKVHTVKEEWLTLEDSNYGAMDGDKHYSLNVYFYAWHWCGCHRWPTDAPEVQTGNPLLDMACPDERFIVRKLWHASRPDLVLMFENVGCTPDISALPIS